MTRYTDNRIRRGLMAADRFTQVSNGLFRDPRITLKAKGLFGLLSTHRDGYGVTASGIARQTKEGVSAIESGLRELERYGYLERERVRRADGTLGAVEYFITDAPAEDPQHPQRVRPAPIPSFPGLGDPGLDDRAPKNTKNTKIAEHERAPSARSAPDAVGQLPVVGARGTAGGSAATGKTSSAETVTAEVVMVAAALPPELTTALERAARTSLPRTVVRAIEAGLRDRTPTQLAERITRRWDAHGYANAALSADGPGLRRPVGVAVALVRPGECPDPSCEDGAVIDSGEACRVCEQRRLDRAGHRPGGLPGEARRSASGGVAGWWECAAPECRAPGKGVRPAGGLCPACQRAGVEAAEVLGRLLGR
ncbi:hypothetical protein ACH427_32225 [Streptomyces sp. NPDC020379]|uniref:hypothetical protein n=1 Tax=Streptomyces sp. NPDC020379 TaxID=3365071 RepID=UPI0037AEA379